MRLKKLIIPNMIEYTEYGIRERRNVTIYFDPEVNEITVDEFDPNVHEYYENLEDFEDE